MKATATRSLTTGRIDPPRVSSGSLYLAAGAVLSHCPTFNILYLPDRGVAADEIGLFPAMLVLLFIRKILLDRLGGRFGLQPASREVGPPCPGRVGLPHA